MTMVDQELAPKDKTPAKFRLPEVDEQAAIIGRNGTGKTQLGNWLLSKQDLRAKPWIILNYKGDALINSISRARIIKHMDMPDAPGVYILNSNPGLKIQDESFLWRLWEEENTGLFIDEGYMVPKKDGGAFEALLTQGRSKHIPIITLSQRPVELCRFVFSEASHVALFHLNDERDVKTVTNFVPRDFPNWVPSEFAKQGRLPPYHARWYDQKGNDGQGARFILKPVPSADQIRKDIDAQLEPRTRMLLPPGLRSNELRRGTARKKEQCRGTQFDRLEFGELDHRRADGDGRDRAVRNRRDVSQGTAAQHGWRVSTMKIVNIELLSNPLNWVIVTLMVLIAGIAVHYVAISAQE